MFITHLVPKVVSISRPGHPVVGHGSTTADTRASRVAARCLAVRFGCCRGGGVQEVVSNVFLHGEAVLGEDDDEGLQVQFAQAP